MLDNPSAKSVVANLGSQKFEVFG